MSSEELRKVGKGLLIALAGAALTYLSEQIPHVDFGVWTPMVVTFWSAFVNWARMYLTDTRGAV